MDNTGSFMGGQLSPALSEAIARRGNTGGATNAVGTGAPTFDASQQPPTSQNLPSGTTMPPSASPVSGGTPEPKESVIILKALNERLKALSDIQKSGGQI